MAGVLKEKPQAETATTTPGADRATSSGYPQGISLALIIISLSISVFLCALDETIIVTAIPKITDDFQNLQDVGWYGSAYFMTFATLQLNFGKVYTIYPIKAVFLVSIFIFEAGSLICAASPSSDVFIFGRALAGVGSGGINAGFIVILAASLPLHRRPLFSPCYTAMYGLAAVVAPLLGGAFAGSAATWRWCFYINLPVGGIAAIIMMWFCRLPADAEKEIPKWRELRRIAQEMDLLGSLILIPNVVCLLLALQWAGAGQYAWKSAQIISLLAVSGLGLVGFVVRQVRKGDKATIPPRVITQRSVACSAAFVFFASGAVTIFQYYLPIWFQAIQNVSPLSSGIRILPTTLSIAIFSFLAGLGVTNTGYYTPFMIFGIALLTGGAFFAGGALTISSPAQIWVSCQLLFGIGAGIGLQQAHTAAQTVLTPADVPIGAVLLIFAHVMGGVVFVPVGQSIFTSELLSGIEKILASPAGKHDSGLGSAKEILDLGANGFRQLPGVAGNQGVLEQMLEAYNSALTRAFLAGGAAAAVALIASLGMEWISIKKKNTSEEVENA
ncbi:azole resistance protein 1 [Naviculisporaceae sp. PSN 640]